MRLRFQFRRYRLPFREVVRTAHGPWTEREGVIVRLEDVSEEGGGALGFGEAAPIPWFGTETVDEVEAGCRAIGEWIEEAVLEAVPRRLGCLRHALASVLRDEGRGKGSRERVASGSGGEEGRGKGSTDKAEEASGGDEWTGGVPVDIAGHSPRPQATPSDPRPSRSTLSSHTPPPPATSRPTLAVAALLPAGRAALAQIAPRLELGYRVFKWKVGVGDLADELSLLDDVCAELPDGAMLRLDANGAWNRRQAERWLERCAERPVEFLEQPIAANARGSDDLLLGLAGDYPTPLGLDESLVGDADLEKWIGTGWPGIFVVKPGLLADVTDALARLERANAKVVFSSALETAIGAKSALRAAFAWKGERVEDGNARRADEADPLGDVECTHLGARASRPHPGTSGRDARVPRELPRRTRALGFGVWPLFADARFDVPTAGPFVRRSDVERIDVEAIWNALS